MSQTNVLYVSQDTDGNVEVRRERKPLLEKPLGSNVVTASTTTQAATIASNNGVNDQQFVRGTLKQTSEPASDYSYFSLTEDSGLIELWDDVHAKYYEQDVKHIVSDFIKPVSMYRNSSGVLYTRCKLIASVTSSTTTYRTVDIATDLIKKDPEYIAYVLYKLYSFNVYNKQFDQFAKALTIVKFIPEADEEEDSGYPPTYNEERDAVIRQSTIDKQLEKHGEYIVSDSAICPYYAPKATTSTASLSCGRYPSNKLCAYCISAVTENESEVTAATVTLLAQFDQNPECIIHNPYKHQKTVVLHNEGSSEC